MMTERRRAALQLAGLMTMISAVCGWLLSDSTATFIDALHSSAPSIRVESGNATMAVLLPILIGIGVLAFLELFRPESPVDAKPRRWGVFVIGTACIALPLALASPWVYRNWAEGMLVERGYVRCQDMSRPSRFPSATFARTAAQCALRAG